MCQDTDTQKGLGIHVYSSPFMFCILFVWGKFMILVFGMKNIE